MFPINDQNVSPYSDRSPGKWNDAKVSKLKQALLKEQEVQHLARSIDEQDLIKILEFGMEPAVEVSRFSDQLLDFILKDNQADYGHILNQLGKVMDRFDRKDFEKTAVGLFSRLFKKTGNVMDRLMSKYQLIGNEIDQIYVKIVKCKREMAERSTRLEKLLEQNYQHYLTLEKYIVAAEMRLNEWKASEEMRLEQPVTNGDLMVSMEVDPWSNAVEALEQRIHDLEMAKMVALQAAPQIKMLQSGNDRLAAKMNSAFVSTIPIFKDGLIQIIAAKRQKLLADSLKELGKRTNRIVFVKSKNINGQSREVPAVLDMPSITIEMIEECYHIIMKGMQETRSLEEENKRLGEKSKERLVKLQQTIGPPH
ncbi:toxic anion resistance protein [Bacillus sp. ISL-35]|uniref:toxic anion resistance protein n=1 Tax=Bacillus sp. ISL-35 TaxID=2819122 RepID=UPI001BE726A0|nr:toxic anion resistance protein [Bacillus sp. ISL-35]MBT2677814.1 toxic anion resistance protein [Bacillus sp. ISL-35]